MTVRVNDRALPARPVLLLGALGSVLAFGGHDPALAALLLVGVPGRDGSAGGLLGVGVPLLGGAAVGGAVGYAVATVATPNLVALGLGGGVAVGGALAVVVVLLGPAQQAEVSPEAVTIEGGEDDPPDPMPADLFAEHPDPLIYYEDAGDGPVVRAVNPAFEATFGVSGAAVTGAALGDALMITAGGADVVAAAADGEQIDLSVACETGQETAEFRIRTAAVSDAAGARGYVVYTPR